MKNYKHSNKPQKFKSITSIICTSSITWINMPIYRKINT